VGGTLAASAWRSDATQGIHPWMVRESDSSNPTLYLPIPTETAHQKARLLAECYPSQSGRGWFDDEVFLGLMRVRGVQCRARYAEAFTVEKALLDTETNYSVN
jgi:hypothetical protein